MFVAALSKVDRNVLDKEGQGSFFTQFPVLTRRSFINMYRDPGYYWLRLVIYIALGFGLGTVFCDIGFGDSSIQVSSISALKMLFMFLVFFTKFQSKGGNVQ